MLKIMTHWRRFSQHLPTFNPNCGLNLDSILENERELYIQDSTFFLYYHVHNSYIEAVVGSEILKSQAPSSNAQKICLKKSHK